jgi:hypothetical protein
MNTAKMPKELFKIYWQEAFQTSPYLNNIILTTVKEVTKAHFEH